jgi:RNA polymerase sigma-70 factor (ECF subfamily)
MHTTSVSMLDHLRNAPNEAEWERFVRQYSPLLSFWARRLGLQDQDAADLVQEVLLVLVQKLPRFQYQPERSFRGWMRTILVNKWRDRQKCPMALAVEDDVPAQSPADAEVFEEREHRLYVLGRALTLMQSAFEPATWQACWQTIVVGRSPAQVAAELGMTVNAVYLAKARVLVRLRQELQHLKEERG